MRSDAPARRFGNRSIAPQSHALVCSTLIKQHTATRELRAYLLANVAFLVPSGLVTILFPWLIVVALHESPERVGVAQMITQLPGLFLPLFTGRVADRIEQRRILVVTQLLMALAQLGIAALVFTGQLSFNSLLGLALLVGIAGVFSGPPRSRGRNPLGEIAVGLRMALRHERIRPALILTFALGLFFVRSFVVLLPLMFRDVYQGGAADLSPAFGANMLCTLVVIGVLTRPGAAQRQGRSFMLSLLFGSIVLSLLYLRTPYLAFFLLSFVRGPGGALTMTMGRSIVQEAAPPELSARLLSI